MNVLTLTPDLQSILAELKEKTTFKDTNGNTVGVFTPWAQAEAELYARARELFERVELDRAEAEEGGSTLEEIMQHLQSLEPPK